MTCVCEGVGLPGLQMSLKDRSVLAGRSERSAHARWSLFGGQLMAETVTVLKQEWSCRLLAPLQVLPSYSTNHVDILFPFCDCRHTTLRLFMSPLT